MSYNYNSFKEIKEFCDENGFGYQVDADVFSKTNGVFSPQDLRMSSEQLHEVLLEIDKIRDFNLHEHTENELICPNIEYSLFIDSNGDAYPCNKYFIKVGNIYNNSIDDIWNNNPLISKLQNLKWKDTTCAKCRINKYCSKCPRVALLEDGNLLGKSSLACDFANVRCDLY
ncbi:SPASM domain-containing protein [Vallitalea longa]|nr:SPASM domain-containing protein [Vallitalea longa]